MYRIGEFSKIVKLTVKTLRFYEETGLIRPAYIDALTGYRYYTTEQLYPLQQIVALRQAGFSIDEIGQVLTGKDLDGLLDRKETELRAGIAEAEGRLNRLSSIKRFFSEEKTMQYQAIVKDLPSYTVYYSRFRVGDFAEYGTRIPAVGAEIAAANPDLKCVRPDFCYVEYLDGEYKERDFSVEYAEAVEKAGVETENVRFKTLLAGKYACVMHKGSYDGLRKAYAYLLSWIEDNGYVSSGNAREQYIDGCWNKEDPDDYLTEVQIPIAKK